jgi:tetratricopeptide (TPR) repeat protein
LILVTGVTNGALLAQARPGWVKPYDDGKKALERDRFDEAIRHLTAAIAVDQKQDGAKPTDGTFREAYFPFVYRGAAYLKKGDLDNAKRDFDKAALDEAGMPRALAAEFRAYRNDLNTKLAARPRPNPPPGSDPPPGPRGNPPPPPPPTGPTQFEKDAATANTLLESRKFAEALTQFDALRQLNATEFGNLRLGPKRDAAARGRADQLITEGQDALTAGRIADARQKFNEADAVVPNSAAESRRLVTQRETEFRGAVIESQQAQARRDWGAAIEHLDRAQRLIPQQFAAERLDGVRAGVMRNRDAARDSASAATESATLLADGKQLAGLRRYAEAETRYQRAVDRNPNNDEARDLLEKSREYGRLAGEAKALRQQNKLAAAGGPLQRAQEIDSARFKADAELTKMLRDIDALPSADSIRAGLAACFEGKWANAISLLEPLAERSEGLEPRLRAHVQAYLGVSHATASFVLASEDERRQARAQAITAFQAAMRIQPDYQLADALVSPKIREIWQQAKAGR